MSSRGSLRRLAFALATTTGIARRGWFIPSRRADAAAESAARPYPPVERAFHAAWPAFAATLARVEDVARDLEAIGTDEPPPAPRWHQDWFPRLDAAVAYAMVRAARPATIIEVGSGHSTRFLARAIADGATGTRLVAIDPAPRAALDGLAIEIVARPLQEADPALFAALGPGDMLFVDSSHVLMPGSDVDDILGRILPELPQGCLLHLHDIFLPDPYPADWSWRGYNEQSAVAPLVACGAWQALFASHWVVTRRPEALGDGAVGRLPLLPGARESSLWLVRR